MRLKFVVFFFVIVWALLLVRIYFLSIKSNSYYEELAERNTIKTESIVPVRGLILDRNGMPLAVNTLGFRVALSPHLAYRKKLDKLDEEINFIAKYFPQHSVEELKKNYLKNDSPYNHDFVSVVDFVPYNEIHKIYTAFSQREEIKILPSTKRHYPGGTVASHVIGYVGRANPNDVKDNEVAKLSGFIGKNGLEKSYNDFLQGELGFRKVKVTAFNREIEELEKKIPNENNNIVLSIDIRLQDLMHSLFTDNNHSGAAVLMDVHNGEVLAAGSYPEYEISNFTQGISQDEWDELINDPHKPFTNKFATGLYPPGSTVKPGMALSFLEFGGMDEHSSVFCTGELLLGDRKFRCWKDKGHGSVDLNRAIKESCDDYFYKGGLKVGVDKEAIVLKKLGLGSKTGIDLPQEFSGVVPTTAWKKMRFKEPWYTGETLPSSIGQGYFLVTPLQMALFSATIAEGKLVTPRLVKKIGDHDTLEIKKESLNDFEKSKLPLIRKGMYDACNVQGGTAFHYTKTGSVKIGCKTGTAQVVTIPQDQKKRIKEEDMEYFTRSQAWMIAYFPYEKPKFALAVLIEHGGHGGSATSFIINALVKESAKLGYLGEEYVKQ